MPINDKVKCLKNVIKENYQSKKKEKRLIENKFKTFIRQIIHKSK